MPAGFHRIWMNAVLAAVVVFSVTFLAQDTTKLSTMVRIRDMWSLVALNPAPPARFAEIDRRDFPDPPIPQVGDTLLTVGGLPTTTENYFRVFSTTTPAGARIPIAFKRGDSLYTTVAVTRAIPAALKAQLVTLYTLRILLTLGLIAVGFWAHRRRGDAPAVRALAMFCYAMAIMMLLAVATVPDPYAAFQIPAAAAVFTVAQLFGSTAPAFWARLQFLFPAPRRRYLAHQRLVNAALFAPTAALAVCAVLRIRVPAWPTVAYSTAFMLGGYALLWRSYAKSREPLLRRQIRLVLLGATPAMVMTPVNAAIRILQPNLSNLETYYLLNLNCLAVLAAPLAFAYAFGRYRLLDVEGKLRRGTRVAVLNAGLLLLFGGFLYAFGTVALRGLAVESELPILAVGFGLAFVFVPTQRWLRGVLEERFYPERVRLRGLLARFLETAGRSGDPARFWGDLLAHLAEGLRARPIHVVLHGREGSMVEPEGVPDRCPYLPQTLWPKLRALDVPVLVDELLASERLIPTLEERACIESCGIALVVPLRGSSGALGFLFLGRKADEEDYSHFELELLRTLAAQIGLAVENLQLLGDRMQRQRLEEQLSVARRIQEGLLPSDLDIPGLEVAARIRFCLEVAGDFYDCVPLRDGRVLLAIGDVAGKGVGAALLMSNVQASLRALRNTGIHLADAVAEVNSIVHHNTPPHLFITLFVGVYDPSTRRLVYVNAGHNPPVLYRSASGAAQQLSIGGLPLGIFDGVRYQQSSVLLQAGDLLVMYTDGVTEARPDDAPGDVEFGLERLTALLPGFTGLGLEAALDGVEEEVRRFSGRTQLEDDLTLLVARVPKDGAAHDRGNERNAQALRWHEEAAR